MASGRIPAAISQAYEAPANPVPGPRGQAITRRAHSCQRRPNFGSGSLSVMASVEEQDALAQQVGFRPAIHLAFDHFDGVAFDSAEL